jgi:hypothetical protein
LAKGTKIWQKVAKIWVVRLSIPNYTKGTEIWQNLKQIGVEKNHPHFAKGNKIWIERISVPKFGKKY